MDKTDKTDRSDFYLALALAALAKCQEAMDLAAKDPLTGLYNRRIFNEVLGREFALAKRHGHSLCLLSLDLDHFKAVNDTYGHQAGDAVLAGVASLLAGVSRSTDVAARLGGEEFALILPHATEAEGLVVAERLRRGLHRAVFTFGGQIIHQTASLGLADSEHFMVNSPEDMVYWADQALYRAKREGRDAIRRAGDISITIRAKEETYALQ